MIWFPKKNIVLCDSADDNVFRIWLVRQTILDFGHNTSNPTFNNKSMDKSLLEIQLSLRVCLYVR